MISFGNQIEPERSLGWSPFSFSSSFSGSGQGGKFPRIYFGMSSHDMLPLTVDILLPKVVTFQCTQPVIVRYGEI